MRNFLSIVFFIYVFSLFADDVQHKQATSESVESIENAVAKIDHNDSIPQIVRKEKTIGKEKLQTKAKSIKIIKDKGAISLICYKGGVCHVKDTRTVDTFSGLNEVIIESFYPGVIEESLSFRTPKNGKISVFNYQFSKKDLSREQLLLSAVGDEVFFQSSESNKLEKGRLLNISREKDGSLAIIESDHKCFLVPINQCLAVGEKALNSSDRDSLHLFFESPDSKKIDIEISYLTANIHWKHVFIVDVFEKLDRVDIFSKAFLKNDTDCDLENINITFNSFFPALSSSDCKDGVLKPLKNSSAGKYVRNLSVKRNSSSVCMLRSVKEQKPKLEYLVKISTKILNSDLLKEVPVGNLLIIENVEKLGIDVDFHDSELFVFHRINNEQFFSGKYSLSSFTKDNAFIFEIGTTNDITAQVQQTDFRKLSEKQSEYGVRVNIQNNKSTESNVMIVMDTDLMWAVTKKNFELQKDNKPSWRINLKPNESKELHFRIRMSN
ncbi:MAG: hypothetical protein LBQ08_01650 [Holosporaceae bacterium]|jgi:hypothetical protein|nr:hypothetical protein [Holosporaceae bacterium]